MKDFLRLPRCEETKKVCFNKKEAQTKRNKLSKRGRSATLRVYQCEYCNYWHLTGSAPEWYGKHR